MSTVFNCLTGQDSPGQRTGERCLNIVCCSLALPLSTSEQAKLAVVASPAFSLPDQLKTTVKLCNKRIFISFAHKLLCRGTGSSYRQPSRQSALIPPSVQFNGSAAVVELCKRLGICSKCGAADFVEQQLRFRFLHKTVRIYKYFKAMLMRSHTTPNKRLTSFFLLLSKQVSEFNGLEH